MGTVRFRLHAAVCGAFLFAMTSLAQQAPAPVPPGLLAAKKVFVSNAGSDSGLFPHPFSGIPERPYQEFYADLQASGLYQLVENPSDADLVFELRLTAPYGPSTADKAKGASDPLPMIRLVIFDRQTHYVMWALTESIEGAFMQKGHDNNLDEAIEALVTDLKQTIGKSPTTK